MKLVVLGSGSSVPHPRRSSSAYWLETESGSLLLDCSASSIHRMAQENLDWSNLDAIWISHFHLDHCGGLAPFLFGTKYAPQTQDRTKPLRIFGPAGVKNLIDKFDSVNDYGLLEQPFPVEVIEVKEDRLAIFEGLSATFFSTPHTPESHAIRLENSGKSIVYTSDTGYSDELAAFSEGCDLLVIECSFVKNKPVEKHLESADLVMLANIAKPKLVVATHLYPEWDDVDFEAEMGKFETACDIIQAFDGLKRSVSDKLKTEK